MEVKAKERALHVLYAMLMYYFSARLIFWKVQQIAISVYVQFGVSIS